jgi:hypothetical protein
MWTYIYISASILSLALLGNKIVKCIKLSNILLKTIIGNKFKPQIYPINEVINHANVIKYGPFTFNALSTHQPYDILCFTSKTLNSKNESEIHGYNLSNEIDDKIPISILRNSGKVCTIPFRPKDYNWDTLFVGIKHLSLDTYSVYRFKSDSYINLLDIIKKYEKDLTMVSASKEVCLAEAYD